MATIKLHVPSAVQEVFKSFISNTSLFGLPLRLENGTIHDLPLIRSRDADSSFQNNLSLLDDLLDSRKPLYLLLRRCNSICAITFVPYRALQDQREMYLHYRYGLVKSLGEERFAMSLICKEIGEVTDVRSWIERDAHQQENPIEEHVGVCEAAQEHNKVAKDLGYKKNKCRLCDRRMKNKITDGAFEALSGLDKAGDCVQIALNPDLVLALDFQTSSLSPELVSTHLPTTHPTFTFYCHPNGRIYFISHSPDSASVQQRMKHTMAIPGLVNVHAEDCGLHVDQKIEIHEPEDLQFQEGDEKVGKFRSMYLRGEWQGTESRYEGQERDQAFYDAVK